MAVVIPCLDARKDIGVTVRACRAIPSVDLIVVVDDGSTDDTAQSARSAGAVAVRHSVTRGRASAMETGVKVVAMRDRADWPPRLILFLDQDLGDSAIEATKLVEAVTSGIADCAIGVTPAQEIGRFTRSEALVAKGVRLATGWEPIAPLATRRCVTRAVLNAVMPFSTGWGADAGITIDLLVEGFSVVEIPCNFQPLQEPPKLPLRSRLARYRDLWVAIWMRRLWRQRIPLPQRGAQSAIPLGDPYVPLNSQEVHSSGVDNSGSSDPEGPRQV